MAAAPTWQECLGLERELERGKQLDRELESVGRQKEKNYDEIEKLVEAWKDQKKVMGVKDSDTETRVQVASVDARPSLPCSTKKRGESASISMTWTSSRSGWMPPRLFPLRT